MPLKVIRTGSDDGFLLSETLATFVISAFVLVGLVSASSVLLRSVDGSVMHVQDVDDLDRTLRAIARDVSGLARARFDGLEPQPFVFLGGPNNVFFARNERGRDEGLETRVVALREIVDGAGTRLTRADARLAATATSFADLRYGPPRTMATGPARLRFSYLAHRQRGHPEPAPVRLWASGLTLPAAMIVEAVDVGTGRLILSTLIPVRADGDIGCLSGTARTDAGPILATTAVSTVLPGTEVTPAVERQNIQPARDADFCVEAPSPGSRP